MGNTCIVLGITEEEVEEIFLVGVVGWVVMGGEVAMDFGKELKEESSIGEEEEGIMGGKGGEDNTTLSIPWLLLLYCE